jgi:hypothetical protein
LPHLDVRQMATGAGGAILYLAALIKQGRSQGHDPPSLFLASTAILERSALLAWPLLCTHDHPGFYGRERRVVSDHHPQPNVVIDVVWVVVVAIRHPSVPAIIIEGSAPDAVVSTGPCSRKLAALWVLQETRRLALLYRWEAKAPQTPNTTLRQHGFRKQNQARLGATTTRNPRPPPRSCGR